MIPDYRVNVKSVSKTHVEVEVFCDDDSGYGFFSVVILLYQKDTCKMWRGVMEGNGGVGRILIIGNEWIKL